MQFFNLDTGIMVYIIHTLLLMIFFQNVISSVKLEGAEEVLWVQDLVD